jgi:hypothetical protein
MAGQSFQSGQTLGQFFEPLYTMHMVSANCLYSAWLASTTCAKCVYSCIWYQLTACIQHGWPVPYVQIMYTHTCSVGHLPVLSMVGWYHMCKAYILMHIVLADCLYLAWSASTTCAEHIYLCIWYWLTACIQHGWPVPHVQSMYTYAYGIGHLPVFSMVGQYYMCKACILTHVLLAAWLG